MRQYNRIRKRADYKRRNINNVHRPKTKRRTVQNNKHNKTNSHQELKLSVISAMTHRTETIKQECQ